MPPAPGTMATSPMAKGVASWSPAVRPPPVDGAPVGVGVGVGVENGVGVGVGVVGVGVGVDVFVSVPVGETVSFPGRIMVPPGVGVPAVIVSEADAAGG